jgi:hypothetical protein
MGGDGQNRIGGSPGEAQARPESGPLTGLAHGQSRYSSFVLIWSAVRIPVVRKP